MMKAYILEDVRNGIVKEVATPIPAHDEVLIKVMAVGICGTDGHLYKGDYASPYPVIPGHEFSGIDEAVGADVKYFKPGQRVSADPNIYCENCDNCKQNRQNFCYDFKGLGGKANGSFAEFMAIPERCVFDIGSLSFTSAAMTEPLSCVLHGQDNARPRFGEKVLIFGAGPIGLMHLQLCRYNGALQITVVDINKESLEMARLFNADYVVESNNMLAENLKKIAPLGFNLIIDCTGIPNVIESAFSFIADEGRLLIFGVCPESSRISVNPYEIFHRELKIIGSFALKKNFNIALDQLFTGRIKVDPLIGKKILLDDLPETLKQFSEGKLRLKTMVYPNGFID
jgi:2-desacetyl-2-hydroxyethyl bacteriochlorophyllide A dehydrogenase